MAAVPDHDFAATELGLPSRVDRMRYVITHMLRYSIATRVMKGVCCMMHRRSLDSVHSISPSVGRSRTLRKFRDYDS